MNACHHATVACHQQPVGACSACIDRQTRLPALMHACARCPQHTAGSTPGHLEADPGHRAGQRHTAHSRTMHAKPPPRRPRLDGLPQALRWAAGLAGACSQRESPAKLRLRALLSMAALGWPCNCRPMLAHRRVSRSGRAAAMRQPPHRPYMAAVAAHQAPAQAPQPRNRRIVRSATAAQCPR